MLKNRVVKKILKQTIFKLLNAINAILPKDNKSVLLYSANKGICYNLTPLKEFLIDNNYNEEYKIICGVETKDYMENTCEKNLRYITRLRAIFVFMFTKYVFYTAGQIPIKPSAKQYVAHLSHGASTIKTFGKLSKINNGNEHFFNHILATSELYRSIMASGMNCSENEIFISGEPMTDVFYHHEMKLNRRFGNFNKLILWAPTFRQSDYLGYNDSSIEELIPLFSPAEYEDLNEECKKYNFMLIVKLHPFQNTDNLNKTKYSHLKIYSHQEFLDANLDLYKLLPSVDVLLADYSSIFAHFYLLDRPIGFVVPDMEEYKEKRGFIFARPEDYMAGEMIREKKELYSFFSDISKGIDRYADKRRQVRDILHQYQDGHNCKRILDNAGVVLSRAK